MKISLDNKAALVTGSTRGIGFAVAKNLASAGASVYINGRSGESVRKAIAQLAASTRKSSFIPLPADITTDAGLASIKQTVPHLDIIVSNAAVFDWTDFYDTTNEHWLEHYKANVLPAVNLARHYMPGMFDKNWGRVVLVASEAGFNIPADMIHYGVAKAAEIALARGLAELTRGTGVTVNSVLPGPTASSGSDEFLAQYAIDNDIPAAEAEVHLLQRIRPTSLLNRLASNEEVANMITYACSEQASATNGAALRVEGGILRHPG
ncbi:SDR family NAD(P)-dependent oxidoreductase [Parahaliea aestuarii]|uniref:SDR family oxidoreductase n=1 Tax=Parahaliea aestuarii TaxID=1852021 RepID=A0A5C8ZTK0_9GAMM|nr:SDR family oxidoreductase [Parahaliea aestuarii]TXS91785.1 SDR family oxidoreductase [Parahaliea aestuarii]